MRKDRKKGGDSYDLMLEYQLEIVELAKAYAERISYQAMVAKYLEVDILHENPEVISLLKTISLSFGIERILRDSGWFFSNGYLNKDSYHFAQVALKHTYEKIAECSHDIIEAYGIPESCITAPIAKN